MLEIFILLWIICSIFSICICYYVLYVMFEDFWSVQKWFPEALKFNEKEMTEEEWDKYKKYTLLALLTPISIGFIILIIISNLKK